MKNYSMNVYATIKVSSFIYKYIQETPWRKPYLFPQKKFVSVFYAINIFNTIYFKPTNRENSTLFSVLLTTFLVYHDLKQKIK